MLAGQSFRASVASQLLPCPTEVHTRGFLPAPLRHRSTANRLNVSACQECIRRMSWSSQGPCHPLSAIRRSSKAPVQRLLATDPEQTDQRAVPPGSSSAFEEDIESEESVSPVVPAAGTSDADLSIGVKFATGAITIYKIIISPVLPNVCRYLPSCSTYSIQAFKEFGLGRGLILMAWRILRCNPWGGSGYDPPKWPPVGLPFKIDGQ